MCYVILFYYVEAAIIMRGIIPVSVGISNHTNRSATRYIHAIAIIRSFLGFLEQLPNDVDSIAEFHMNIG
jgi:hypothetical protein